MSSRLTRPTVSSQQKVQPKRQYIGPVRSRSPNKRRVAAAPPKFNWRVNEKSGYFELGTPSPDDDCYILATTLVSCEYFQLLESRLHDVKQQESSFWQVQFNLFGCDIPSDPFQLSNEKETRHTFIGDKATCRIRCNGALFYEFLETTTIEFRIFRSVGVNGLPRLVGRTYAALKSLTETGIDTLKGQLQILLHDDTEPSGLILGPPTPELRVIIDMNVEPNKFVGDKPTDDHIRKSRNMEEDAYIEDGIPTKMDADDDEPPSASQDISKDSAREAVMAAVASPRQKRINNEDLEYAREEIQRCLGEGQGESAVIPNKPKSGYCDEEESESGSSIDQIQESASAAGDTLDGMAASRHSRDHVEVDKKDSPRLPKQLPNNLANLSNDEIIKIKVELEEKQRSYLKLLDWNKRDEEHEQNTRNITLEQAALKEKLEAKELYLEEMQSSLRRRELEVEEFANKATFGLNQRVEEMKVRMNLMKEKHRNDLDLLTAKLESAQTETERLNAKVKSLQGKLVIREDQIDELNAMRSQWPDITLERKLVRLEEKTEALSNELTKVRRERDSYRNGAQRLAERVDKLQRQLETLRCNENEALRAHIFLNEERKDLRKDREAAAELAKNLEELAKTYSQKDTNIQEANLLTEKIAKRTHRHGSSGAQLLSNRGSRSHLSSIVNDYKKYLQPGELSKMSAEEIDAELTRLVGERDKMIGNGEVLRTDPIIQKLDQALTRMASDLMARNQIPSTVF